MQVNAPLGPWRSLRTSPGLVLRYLLGSSLPGFRRCTSRPVVQGFTHPHLKDELFCIYLRTGPSPFSNRIACLGGPFIEPNTQVKYGRATALVWQIVLL